MKALITAALGLILSVKSFATAQIPDIIFWNGKEYMLHSNPLEDYFEKHPEKRPKNVISSTALWRGYVATFEIRDSILLVKDIQIEYWDEKDKKGSRTKWKSVMQEVFPGGNEVKVDWLTGLLVLPYGDIVNYIHMGYGSTYENYFLLEIDSGKFVKSKGFDYIGYENFKEKQFEAYKKTDDYKNTKARLKVQGEADEFIDDFLRSFVISYTSKILVDE